MAAENPKAVFHTSEGDFTCELFPDKAPKTVANFVGLAKGTKVWTDPATGQVVKDRALYNNTKFHRTIKGFMIQGGDPLGTGTGGPGYRFEDEFSDLKFEGPGILAMANAGPGTNGSQFFVTVGPTPHLTGRHTIFGKIASGMDVVEKIVSKPSEPGSGKALDPVIIKSIEIVEVGAKPAAGDAATTGSDKGTTGTAAK
jgi:peptidyl-prolyl cis-trans isomerase A (cyclophilin A)